MKERRKKVHWKSWFAAAVMIALIQYDVVCRYIDGTWAAVSFLAVLILIYAKDFANNRIDLTFSAGASGVSITEKRQETTKETTEKKENNAV